ncbi:MAG: hypothetical protein LBS22_02780 [Puniceicoccales bacterium]|jgi:hypothetical protein|nr:hypothetical protein [Puniceicoccales bacterium]
MKSFEEICCDVVKQPKFIKNATIGLILGLIPIVNFFAFGYLVEMGKQSTKSGDLSLPDWPCVKGNFKNTLIENFSLGAIAFFEFILIPCLLGFSLFGLVGLEIFGICVGLFISAPAFAYATVSDSLKIPWNAFAIFTDFSRVYKWVLAHYKKLAIPSALFLCFQVVISFVMPYTLMGAPIFLGLLFMVSYVKQMSKQNDNSSEL